MTLKQSLGLAAYVMFLILICVALQRLYFSPLARFPGPRLAALTGLVETYYEIFAGEGGQFPFAYHDWHKKYGPIIRINPWEIHIEDALYYENFYARNKPHSKVKALAHRFGNPTSAFSTVEHHVHRQRRAPMDPFFSKRKIINRSDLVQGHINELCNRLDTEFKGKGDVIKIKNMFGCLSADVMTHYCFGKKINAIHAPEFAAPIVVAMCDIVEPVHWFTQFPILQQILQSLPGHMQDRMATSLAGYRTLDKELNEQCIEVQNKMRAGKLKEEEDESIFVAMLRSELPDTEKTLQRMHDEAISLVGAGIESAARAMTVTFFHILNNPPVLEKLKKELAEAIPDPKHIPTWDVLQQLPWLSCCVEEALRLTYGTGQRIPRILDNADTIYKDYAIPAGTIVSMDIWAVSHDENVFPDSFTFKPERWEGSPRAPDGKHLSRYQVSFGRGTRACVGTQLGYAEIYLAIATLIRRFEFEPVEFDIKDVQLHRDRFAVRPPLSSKGVRALVK